MVLQMAPAEAHVWGYADSGTVDILVDGHQEAQATVGADGTWSVNLPAMDEGGPHTIEVQAGGQSTQITDVMFGDVWVCSGQSNMEFEFHKVSNCFLVRYI